MGIENSHHSMVVPRTFGRHCRMSIVTLSIFFVTLPGLYESSYIPCSNPSGEFHIFLSLSSSFRLRFCFCDSSWMTVGSVVFLNTAPTERPLSYGFNTRVRTPIVSRVRG